MTTSFTRACCVATLAAAAVWSGGRAAQAEDVTITVWSHEADEPAKVAFREQAAARTWRRPIPASTSRSPGTRRTRLYAALKTALPAGQGPDVFYLEPDQTEYITNGYIVPLDDLVDWSNDLRLGARRSGPMTARPGACRRRPIPTSSTTTRTCWTKLGVDAAGQRPVHPGAVPRPGEEGARRRHHADRPGRRRPALSRRLHPAARRCCASSAPTITASCSTASSRSRIRASSRSSPG